MKRNRGFTMIEVLVAIGLVSLIGILGTMSLVRRKGATDLDASTRQLVASFREAQGRSMSQSLSKTWGVYLSNSTSVQFFAVYWGVYATSSRTSYTRLPPTVRFVTSSLPVGATTSVTFSQIAGLASASTTIRLQLVNEPTASTTIRVASSGAVSF